ncbi:LuxR family transcriptional regulator [Notoacmeibacter sp. MSK16QG-6]|uniref:helix-turn-helix transcriptional regulator n=1 Tax=Notoacmeibacter sp. MSK16QG-6 TaxID=2957982 RepID=UPI0020A147D6|nr:LuxR family transcriptional regulator [Notoacmeibacter sp. MSK16QG-6]MCP1200025.1 LuxR family transcriptional regulator [Notoacmeibacter sp. MSK16QG-6]
MLVELERLTAFAERITQADTRDAVWNIACDHFAEVGFDGIFYADLSAHNAVVRTNLEDCWTDHYAAEQYFEIDPFFRHSCNRLTVSPTGEKYFDEHPYLNCEERRFILTAGETGMKAGLALPFRIAGPEGVGGWNVLTTHGREIVEQHRGDSGRAVYLAALLTHERMRNTVDKHDKHQRLRLTERETETLHWAACGLRNKEIAEKMRVSAATVEFHGRNARHKLGAKTREQAVAIALTRGLIAM